MQGIIEITQTNTTEATEAVTGAGNYAAYFDFSAMQAGDALSFRQLLDVAGSGAPKTVSGSDFTAEDLAIASEEGALAVPVTLEEDQVLVFELTLTAGAAPLSVPYRVTNIQTGV